MLRSRIIPCLLVHNKGLVKTTKFRDAKYVGDPLNAVKIFNEKEADELIVLDIDASVEGRGPDFHLIENLAVQCRMPFCYGGGVSTVQDAKKIIKLGAEKVALSSAAVGDLEILERIGGAVGVQSVVVVVDVKKRSLLGGYEIYTHNGTRRAKIKTEEFFKGLNRIGVGEVVINSIENDGVMAGYDFHMFDYFRDLTDFPMTILGGAGKLDDLVQAIDRYNTIGVAAGSLFVFKGKYKAVLISYPSKSERRKIFGIA